MTTPTIPTYDEPALGMLIVLAKIICDKDCHSVCERCLNEARAEWEAADGE